MEQFDDVAADNLKTARSKHAEAMTDAQIERHFRSHPELKPGRDFRANIMRYQVAGEQIGDRFDETFSFSPDSPEWWDKQFCLDCDRRHSLCRC